MYYPSIVTAALFIGLIFSDIMNKNTANVSAHAFFGLLCTGITVVLSQNGADLVAWGLLLLPLILLFISFVLIVVKSPWGKKPAASTSAAAAIAANPSIAAALATLAPPPTGGACNVQTPAAMPAIVPTPLVHPPAVIQGTTSTTASQPAAVNPAAAAAAMTHPLSAYVTAPPAKAGPALTPMRACPS